MWDHVAQFVGTDNVALQTVESPDFRNLLQFAFQQGSHQGSHAAFKAFCLVQNATVLRERIVRVAFQDRADHEALLSKFPGCALSMDTAQIDHVKLFVIHLAVSNISLCFTANIMKIEALNCRSIHDIVVQTVQSLA
jgi:hypothetical protein